LKLEEVKVDLLKEGFNLNALPTVADEPAVDKIDPPRKLSVVETHLVKRLSLAPQTLAVTHEVHLKQLASDTAKMPRGASQVYTEPLAKVSPQVKAMKGQGRTDSTGSNRLPPKKLPAPAPVPAYEYEVQAGPCETLFRSVENVAPIKYLAEQHVLAEIEYDEEEPEREEEPESEPEPEPESEIKKTVVADAMPGLPEAAKEQEKVLQAEKAKTPELAKIKTEDVSGFKLEKQGIM
jgi:hypothetical protein